MQLNRYIKTKMQITLLPITSLLLLLPVISYADFSVDPDSIPTITCGIANKYKDRLIISNQTKKIPFITKQENPNFNFGCKIHSPGNVFELHAEITTPQAKNLTSDIDRTKNNKYKTVRITTKPQIFRNTGNISLKLNEDDPQGNYEIKLFIDNEHVGDMLFDVNKSYNKTSK